MCKVLDCRIPANFFNTTLFQHKAVENTDKWESLLTNFTSLMCLLSGRRGSLYIQRRSICVVRHFHKLNML